MLRHVCCMALLAMSLTGCSMWNMGKEMMSSSFRPAKSTDIDTAGGDTIPSEMGQSWGGDEFSGARGSSRPEAGDPLHSETARDIERRLGVD